MMEILSVFDLFFTDHVTSQCKSNFNNVKIINLNKQSHYLAKANVTFCQTAVRIN